MNRWLAKIESHPHSSGVLSAVLLTFAAAPFGQWYLAWIALTPWLISIAYAPSTWSAFTRGWLTGIVYFTLNEWWLWTATIPGTIGVIVCSGFYWGLAAAFIHFLQLLRTRDNNDAPRPTQQARTQLSFTLRVIAIPVVWVTAEWLRCNTVSEFPWLPIGSTQTPAIAMCQIADIAGLWAVSFIVVLTNALLATACLTRFEAKQLRQPTAFVAIVLVVAAAYGTWRLTTTPQRVGPLVMLIQSNHPHIRGGSSMTTPGDAAKFFLSQLEHQLADEHADLIILPENEFPPLNDEARTNLAQSPIGQQLELAHRTLTELARKHNTSILVGGAAVTGWTSVGKEHIGSEIRNSAYLFSPTGVVSRYDKIRLVPFSERLPFSTGPAWLSRISLLLAANRAVQPLHPGTFADLQPFSLSYSTGANQQAQATFVTPICLENVDPVMSSRLARDPVTGAKRADFFANLSNDGWFHAQERHQHWQLLAFRCIENRLPMARSSNTGISGIIDSCGRVLTATRVDQPAVATGRLNLDDRQTIYMSHPSAFPLACAFLTATALLIRAGYRLSGRAQQTGS